MSIENVLIHFSDFVLMAFILVFAVIIFLVSAPILLWSWLMGRIDK